MKYRLNSLALALNAALTLSLAACGGGGGSAEVPLQRPTLRLRSWTRHRPNPCSCHGHAVGRRHGRPAIRNAVVCMDLNANGACDADERRRHGPARTAPTA